MKSEELAERLSEKAERAFISGEHASIEDAILSEIPSPSLSKWRGRRRK